METTVKLSCNGRFVLFWKLTYISSYWSTFSCSFGVHNWNAQIVN